MKRVPECGRDNTTLTLVFVSISPDEASAKKFGSDGQKRWSFA